ncbi:transferase [Brevibacillus sp. SKDU10]|uniref:citramalate synthase n=1 Tax=Brevibacillus sp. SKDU10 TaxID=1247872 RepID=UPI0007C90DF6|nr:citramalate synthase [Brevibacillus sp. SKDU10]OAJ74851.1 transferase [Brevibacillus sp. SKDU10]
MKGKKIYLYDTTLRDGTQGEGISLSVEDKVKIAVRLDQFGVDYIEGGWPGSNPKDMAFFKRMKEIGLEHSRLTAFGSTCRPNLQASQDDNLRAILESGVSAASIFGKAWDLHVSDALKTTLAENRRMIYDSVKYLHENGLEVMFLAEHFFDGYKANPLYALDVLQAAEKAGADWIVLCDTNGGTLPHEMKEIVIQIKEACSKPIGIHPHNDCELAVANAIAAVQAGAEQVQGTINGIGERCGNVNLVSAIPNLQVKLGYHCVSDDRLKQLTSLSRYVAEIANITLAVNQPFVGNSAFAHKGGIHVSAVMKNTATYEHIEPEVIGNRRRILVSELSGQSNLVAKAEELQLRFHEEKSVSKEVVQRLKDKEYAGYQYEGAEASLTLMLLQESGEESELFQLESFKVFMEKKPDKSIVSEAMVKCKISGQTVHTVAEGNGPVNALDNALRKALEQHFPTLSHMHVKDYKVRVLDESEATSAKVRVLIESTHQGESWSTVGVSTNVIEASWEALTDSIRYLLWKQGAEALELEQEEARIGIVNH